MKFTQCGIILITRILHWVNERSIFWLHDHSPAERPYAEYKECNDCDAQSQYDPRHSKRREHMAVITGDHSETQSFSCVGEWIKERNDLEPSNRVKRTPGIIRTASKNQWREDQGEHQANLFWFDQRADCQA